MSRDEIIKALDWHAPSVESGSQSLLRRVEKLVAMAEAAERDRTSRLVADMRAELQALRDRTATA
jgi:hypothetical protein